VTERERERERGRERDGQSELENERVEEIKEITKWRCIGIFLEQSSS
jgi:hypothetical protein